MDSIRDWHEEPMTLAEQIARYAALRGAETRPVKWKGATKEPFLTLTAQGYTKRENITRLANGDTITIHLWVGPEGQTLHPKIKTT